MRERLPVFVYAQDPISEAGLAAQLRCRPDILVLEQAAPDRARVAVVLADEVDDAAVRAVRAIQRNGCPKVVVVLARLDDAAVLRAAEAGACALVRRSDATSDQLAEVVHGAARGEGSVPADVLARLLDQVGRLQRHVLGPRGLTISGFAERELQVLRLVADGHDTAEIARELAYSERTIKNVLHDVTSRLELKSRAQAVAYAMREGLI
jgi:DNA-binding NarL/FixJ family response regulator